MTAISIQTDEAFIVRGAGSAVPIMCQQCPVSAPMVSPGMVSPEDAAGLARCSVRKIYRMIEAGQLHFQETSAGAVVVCLESLRKTVPGLDEKVLDSKKLEGNQSPKTKSEENES